MPSVKRCQATFTTSFGYRSLGYVYRIFEVIGAYARHYQDKSFPMRSLILRFGVIDKSDEIPGRSTDRLSNQDLFQPGHV
jgi:hypothetical protein